jgi:superoxide dismutase, Fe-Mn family
MNHESLVYEKWINSQRTLTFSGVIGAQMGSLKDLKTYVMAAAMGMLSSNGFVWLVTDSQGRLGVVPTYGAGTLLAYNRKQTNAPEFGGLYQPAEPSSPSPSSSPSSPSPPNTPSSSSSSPSSYQQHPQPTSPASGLAPPPLRTDPPAGAHAFNTSARASVGTADDDSGLVARPTSVWSGSSSSSYTSAPSSTGAAWMGLEEHLPAPAAAPLDTLGQTLYPLFCVSVHEHAWMAAGYGVWGKEEYLERFWTCLDWAAVLDSYTRYVISLRAP